MLFSGYIDMLNWLENNLLPCPFKTFTGIDCPLCGLQRALLALAHGNFMASLSYQPATIPLLFAVALSIPNKRPSSPYKQLLKKAVYASCALIIGVAYLYKITPALT